MLKLIHQKNNKGELFMKRLYYNIIYRKNQQKQISTNTCHMNKDY